MYGIKTGVRSKGKREQNLKQELEGHLHNKDHPTFVQNHIKRTGK